MSITKSARLFAIVFVIAPGLLSTDAFSCTRCGAANPRKGCDQLITLKFPDLKGANRKKEFHKCLADPDGYNK